MLSTSTAPGTAFTLATTSSFSRCSSAMSSPRRYTLSGACVGEPCMNSGSATVILSSGICLSRARMSSFSCSRPRSRSCFLPAFTRSDAFSGLPSKPTVEKICRTSGIALTTFSTSTTCCDGLLERRARRHFDVHHELAAVFRRARTRCRSPSASTGSRRTPPPPSRRSSTDARPPSRAAGDSATSMRS